MPMLGWRELHETCLACEMCELYQSRRNVVFGTGSVKSPLLIVGEAPGVKEDELGQPFVGRAGELLNDMLRIIELEREMVYIANIIKCRPPGNRDPLPEEKEACMAYLRNQTYLLRPKIIVCLGRIAAGEIIKPDFKITKEHGVFFEKNGVKIMAIYHPAAMLRDPSRRIEAFEDLKTLKKEIDSQGLVF